MTTLAALLFSVVVAAVLALSLRRDRVRQAIALADSYRRELSTQDGDMHGLRQENRGLKRQVRGLQLAYGRAVRRTRAVEAAREKDNTEWKQISSGVYRRAIDAEVRAERLVSEVERMQLDGIEAQLRQLEAGR